jgi:aconitate hydratase
MISTLSAAGAVFNFFDLRAFLQASGRDVAELPFVIRILLENLGRHRAWGSDVAEEELDAVANWSANVNRGVPLHAERVILPDSSGVPVLQDLAALRDAVARGNGNVDDVDMRIPLDLIVDHSLQVDNWADAGAHERNMKREFERNGERYSFIKWAQQAFRGLRVFPPGMGIIHQINLEYIAAVIQQQDRGGSKWAFPEFMIGGDSHTPTVNALGVLAWGVGGIDAEAALLGHAYTFPVPEVIGVRLVGEVPPAAMTTDAVLLITRALRQFGVAGNMVEFFGPAISTLPVAARATIANMAPEYGATCGFFPVDGQTLRYLHDTGRSGAQVEIVEAYCRANAFWRDEQTPTPHYSRVLEIDLSQALPSIAGPRRPQDLMGLDEVPLDFQRRLHQPLKDGGFGVARAPAGPAVQASGDSIGLATPTRAEAIDAVALPHGAIVLAAITSCTNTTNPAVMMAAGLVAKKAVARGLKSASWVKTSLAPGSQSVTQYLGRAGLMEPLEQLGFNLIGYGCTTCGGKSGPLDENVAAQIDKSGLVVAAVLSGNRNFEGRIHKMIRANYIGSPPMVVLYALAGRIDINLLTDSLGLDRDGQPVYMRDLWPSAQEIQELLPLARDRKIYEAIYAPGNMNNARWQELSAPQGPHFKWDLDSLYLVEPPFFNEPLDGDSTARLAQSLKKARVLCAFGDSLTTDHISPGGEIPTTTPAGQYLLAAGVAQRDFNSYVGRRGNFQIMARATFANVRVKNALVPDVEGGYTRHFPDGAEMTIFDASNAYRSEGYTAIVLGGKEYGTGSSRDWAAKGSALLGVRAVIAESFERIHRANLIGMGVLPLAFVDGASWKSLGLTGEELFEFANVENGVREGEMVQVTARRGDQEIRFDTVPQVLTLAERRLLADGGIPSSVLRDLLAA